MRQKRNSIKTVVIENINPEEVKKIDIDGDEC